MKILLVAAGYPPEIAGENELEVQALARALAQAGIGVAVVAGALARAPETRIERTDDGAVPVHRIQRADLHSDHWQKSKSTSVARLFRALVNEEQPDVVHVHHWQRLTRDLVHCAASENVPALVTLHDAWTTCLIATRVLPRSGEECEAELGASPCLACAQRVPPKTPWVPIEAQHMALAERNRDLARELALARAVLVASSAQAASIQRFWPAVMHTELTLRPPFRESSRQHASAGPDAIRGWLELYARVRDLGPPALSAPQANDWYSARMGEFAETEWDQNLSRLSPRELGF